MKTYLLLMAGGVGNRVGAGIPKQFIKVLGKPVISYTMEIFQNHKEIDAIVLICLKGFEKELLKLAEEAGISKLIKIVNGGSDYEHSILNGVRGLDGIASEEDIIMIHWAASPFVSDHIISDNLRVCKEKGNAISACRPFLLYGVRNGDHSDKVIDRDSFMCLSAPQSFTYKNIVDFYNRVESEKLFDKIEAHTTNLMAGLNIPIFFSEGSQTNIKITTKEDLDLFEGFLLAKKKED